MTKTRVEVLAQYIDENGRKKGGQQFFFHVEEADIFLHIPNPVIKEAIQAMLDDNYEGCYIYVSHQLQFFEPIELKDNFETYLQEIHDMHSKPNYDTSATGLCSFYGSPR
jgi:hypothetical protein